jgi:lysophospholipase L1-like esterase
VAISPMLPISIAALVFLASRGHEAPSGRPATPPPAGGGGPRPPEWWRYGGARPEIEGWPHRTILAVPGLAAQSPAVRLALLELAQDTGIPVDSLATMIGHESGWKPAALNPVPAAGLVQITTGANLPPFTTADAVRDVATWSAERQMAEVVRPLWLRHKGARNVHPGKALLLNFLPADANKAEAYILADDDAWRTKVYAANKGLDTDKDGNILVGEVFEAAGRMARAAKGRRLTVEGALVEPAAAGAPSSKGPYGATVVAVARELLGVKETGPNSGPEIDAWTRELGLVPPVQWCAVFVAHTLRVASQRTGVPMPVAGHGRAKALLEQFAVRGRALSAEAARATTLPPGTVLVWDRSDPPGSGPQGHTGLVEADKGDVWWTIEGNTDDNAVSRRVRPKTDPRFMGAGLVDTMSAAPPVAPQASPGAAKRVLVAGDSLAVGLAPALAKALAPIPVQGFGVNSTTIAQWASVIGPAQPLLAALQSGDRVLLSLGTNDIAGNVPADAAAARARELVAFLKSRGAVVGWVLPPELPWPGWAIRARLSQALSNEGVPEFDSTVATFERAPDKIHATPTGYAQWAQAIAVWAKAEGLV